MKALLMMIGVLCGAAQEDGFGNVSDLIRRLRSDDIVEREDAAKKLRAMGKPAAPELEKAAKEDDLELSARARDILRRIADDTRPRPKLEDIRPTKATLRAPAVFKAEFQTSKGTFIVKVTREWAPLGADRFYNLVKMGYYDDCRFFRVIANFIGQFGIHGNPEVAALWKDAKIDDDPVMESNTRGRITFATRGRNTRTTQLFINYKDNGRLDGMGFAPFGEVIEGISVVDGFYAEYGEAAPAGRGPNQGRIQAEGNKYLEDFAGLDYIKSAKIID